MIFRWVKETECVNRNYLFVKEDTRASVHKYKLRKTNFLNNVEKYNFLKEKHQLINIYAEKQKWRQDITT